MTALRSLPVIVATVLALQHWPSGSTVAQGPDAAAAKGRVAQAAVAVSDDAQALYDRAITLMCGSSGVRNPAEAARLLAIAAEQGHAGAQSVLGWLHMTGTGMPRDDARAARWLRPAAEAGDTAAQNNLGVLHAIGQGVAHDHAAAERWFRAAADKGAADAARNLDVLRGGTGRKADTRGLARPAVHPALASARCRSPASGARKT